MGDIDHLSRSRTLVGLIQPGLQAQRVSIPVLAEKSVGADLRADGLQGKAFGESRTKQIRAEIVSRDHPAKSLRQLDRSVGSQFLAALVLPRVGLPLGGAVVVNHSEIFGPELVVIADRAKDRVLRPTPCGVKRGSDGGIIAAIDGPEKRVSQDGAPGGRLPKERHKKAALAPQVIDRVFHPGKIEDGNALDAQGGVMHGGFGARFHEGRLGVELPLRFR